MTDTLFDKAQAGSDLSPVILLAHGAGAGFDSPFMACLSRELADAGVSVLRFEFPYMQKRRSDGRKRPPDRQPVLLEAFADRVRQLRQQVGGRRSLVVGGKSMGGRMASLLAAQSGIAEQIQAVACFGYPFHAPGKPERWRTDHFPDLTMPMAIFQGTRDPFGKPEEFAQRPPMPDRVGVHWLEGGNHDLRPLKRQGLDPDALIRQAATEAAQFIKSIPRP